MKRLPLVLILVFAFIGLSDSAYLAGSQASGEPLICNIGVFSQCNEVAASPYSRFMGIPLADFGVAFYGLIFIIAAVELVYRELVLRRAIQGLAAVGLIASAYFTFLQISVINAMCIYCVISALMSLFIFIFAYFIEPLSPRQAIPLPSPRSRTDLVLPPPV